MVISIVSVVYKNQEPSLVWGTTLEGPSLHHSVAWRQASRVTSRMFFLTSSWRKCQWKKPLENDVLKEMLTSFSNWNVFLKETLGKWCQHFSAWPGSPTIFSIVRRDFTSIWPPKNWHIFHWKLIFQSPTHGRDHVGGNTYTLMSKVGVELCVLL